MPARIDLTGQRFGRLVVIRRGEPRDTAKVQRTTWYCQCDCGNIHEKARTEDLKRSKTTSCGCRRKEVTSAFSTVRYREAGAQSVLWRGVGEMSGKMWTAINQNASVRGLTVEVTKEYAWELFLKQNRRCALSGMELTFGDRSRNSSDGTASLDRIDSRTNYVEGNVQWVHKHLNHMKLDHPEDYFIELCKKVTEYRTNG